MQKFMKIDQYQLMQILGKGANGFVYKGLNTINGSLVAVKQLFIGKSQVKSIKTQLSLLKNLDHPCIVKFIDAIQKQNKIYLVLQFMQGGSLAILVKRSPLQEDVAKIYVKQILRGLAFLHKKQVIHRDIKGANILLTKNGFIKLADFGVAVKLEDNQKTISAAGSPYWMAPEIISSNGQQPSIKCDIWSLGCTIIELLTGNPPYHNLMQFPALFRIVQDKHPPLPDCSEECKQFLLACFTKDPSKRPSADELLNFAWIKNASEIETKSVQDEQQLSNQISSYMVPNVRYNQLLKWLERTKKGMLICKNKYFQSIAIDKSNSLQRIKFIALLTEMQTETIPVLDKFGIFGQQYGKISIKNQHNQEYDAIFTQLNCNIVNGYCKKINQFQMNKGLFLVSSDPNLLTFQSIFLNLCLNNISNLIRYYNKKSIKMLSTLVQCICKFIQSVDCYKCEQEKSQIMIQIILELEDKNVLHILINFGFLDKGDDLQNQINLNKLNFLEKTIKYFGTVMQIKPQFKKQMTNAINNILVEGLIYQNQSIAINKLACLIKLVSSSFSEICKAQLQRQGLIHKISQYYNFLNTGMENKHRGQLFESFILLQQFLKNAKGGVDRNRLLQLQRHGGLGSCQSIFDNLLEKQQSERRKQSSELCLKIIKIKAIFSKLVVQSQKI